MRRPMLVPMVTMVLMAAGLPASAQQPGATQAAAQAQQARPGVVVVSYNKCRLDMVARLDSLAAAAFYPVLDEMVRERRLLSWGVLGHQWGDEWNFVIYYTAVDQATFHAAFRDAFSRVMQRRPGFMTDFASSCTEHKDNIYSVMRLSAPPPPPPR